MKRLAFIICISLNGIAFSQSYDNLNRLTSETYPDGSTVMYVYDKAGNLKQIQVTPAPDRDEDGDKMTDAFELAHTQNNTALKPNEDKDADGKTNLHEYAFGLNPSQFDTLQAAGVAQRVIDTNDNKTYQQFSYRRRKNSNLTYTPQISTNLQNWNAGASFTSEISVTDNGDGTENVVVRCLLSIDDNTKCFFRVLAQ